MSHTCPTCGTQMGSLRAMGMTLPLAPSAPTAEDIFAHIQHGDEEHKRWLLEKLREILPANALQQGQAARSDDCPSEATACTGYELQNDG